MTPFRRSWHAAGLALGILAGVHAAGPASACVCAEPSPEVAYARAAIVFAGTVVGIEQPLSQWLGLSSSGDRLVRFTVTRRWKGVPGASEIVRALLAGEACGYPFREGETYLVYAVGTFERRTGICDGTKELSIAEKDVQVLDALSGK